VLRNPNRYSASTIEAYANAKPTVGRQIVRAFAAGDAAAMTELLGLDATFHSPVTDYHGRERVAEVLGALVQVITDVRVTRVLDGPEETSAFFEASLDGRAADGVLLVLAAPAGELTLMIRPLRSLLAGIERMKVLLDVSAD
jgi:SnoaL-like domain